MAHDLLLSFCECVNLEPFEKIYQTFVPVLDYDSHCFKIINQYYVKHLNARERYHLKHRHEKDYIEENFHLIRLQQGSVIDYSGFKVCSLRT